MLSNKEIIKLIDSFKTKEKHETSELVDLLYNLVQRMAYHDNNDDLHINITYYAFPYDGNSRLDITANNSLLRIKIEPLVMIKILDTILEKLSADEQALLLLKGFDIMGLRNWIYDNYKNPAERYGL